MIQISKYLISVILRTLPSIESNAWQYVTVDPSFLKLAPFILQQHNGITSLSGGVGPGGAFKYKVKIKYNGITSLSGGVGPGGPSNTVKIKHNGITSLSGGVGPGGGLQIQSKNKIHLNPSMQNTVLKLQLKMLQNES